MIVFFRSNILPAFIVVGFLICFSFSFSFSQEFWLKKNVYYDIVIKGYRQGAIKYIGIENGKPKMTATIQSSRTAYTIIDYEVFILKNLKVNVIYGKLSFFPLASYPDSIFYRIIYNPFKFQKIEEVTQ